MTTIYPVWWVAESTLSSKRKNFTLFFFQSS